MPKLWDNTIQAHRHEVREAILDATWDLVSELGPSAVKMVEVAQKAGIGRATLYKYFPDVGAILAAWHERHVRGHLGYLVEVRDATDAPGKRLRTVLEAYADLYQARIRHRHTAPHGLALDTLLHQGQQVAHAQRQLQALVCDLLKDAAKAGEVRDDVAPDELARYCLHALTAASTMSSDAAVQRLVAVTLAGLHPPKGTKASRKRSSA